MRSFLCFPGFKEKALTLSYDDGVIFDKKLIEILRKNALKCTFNINSSLYGKYRRLSKDEAIALYSNCEMEVAAHGYEHLSLANIDLTTATNEVIQDRKELENTFNCIVNGLAYANGSYSDEVVGILKTCGINYARTVNSTCAFDLPEDWLKWHPTCHHNSPNLMELADEFLSCKRPSYFWSYRPKLFYVWGHSYEFNDKNNWEIIEKFAEYIANKEDVWYATNSEIYSYVKAYDSLVWSVDSKFVYNPTATDVFINYLGNQLLVSAGKMIKTKV
jgi:peptidoglycan/xylan/chitin deacetylase (PgdA/CDA1 family)